MNNGNSIPFADVLLTGICNQICPTCISAFEKKLQQRTMSMQDIANCANFLISLGTKVVSVSGGEPFIVPHAGDALRYFHNRGIAVQVETNALNLPAHYEKIRDIIRWFSFSMDGATREVNFQMRPQTSASLNRWGYQFDAVIRALETLKRDKSKARVKIGSLVCEENASSIIHLADILREYPNIRKWKLYQMRPSSPRFIPDDRFNAVIENIEEQNRRRPFPFELVVNPRQNLDNCVILMIRSDTMAVFTEISREETVVFGRIGVDADADIVERIREMPEIAERVAMRYEMTYAA